MAKTILITGGAGFVGSHLADALLAAGHHVRIFDNLTGQVHRNGMPEYLAEDAEFVQGDVRDSDAMRRALAGIEVVFHMAAAVGVGRDRRPGLGQPSQDLAGERRHDFIAAHQAICQKPRNPLISHIPAIGRTRQPGGHFDQIGAAHMQHGRYRYRRTCPAASYAAAAAAGPTPP